MCRQIANLHLGGYFKLANWLVKEFDFIAVEDLDIKGLGQGICRRGVHNADQGFSSARCRPTRLGGLVGGLFRLTRTVPASVVLGVAPLRLKTSRSPSIAHCDINAALLILQQNLEWARRDGVRMVSLCLQGAVG